jgi:hypothetical protein
MAEWLFTDFFDSGVSAARDGSDRADARFQQIKATLANRADKIENSAQREQNHKSETEENLGSEQLAHEVHL